MRISAPTKSDRVGEWEITAIKPDIPITVDMIEAVMSGMCSLPHQSHRHIEQAKRFMRLLVPIVTAAEQQQLAAATEQQRRDAVAGRFMKHDPDWPVDHEEGE